MGRVLPPFAFFARLLGPLGAGARFWPGSDRRPATRSTNSSTWLLRMSAPDAPSLAAFLTEVEALDVSIKRDMDTSDAYVRVMTAHAAKGLEAKIVFLPDVCGAPGGNHDGRLFP